MGTPMRKFIFSLLLVQSMFGVACMSTTAELRHKLHQDIHQAIQEQGFEKKVIATSTFSLYALLRPAPQESDTLHVYIEGDGLAWVTRARPSTDPTPTQATTLDLARHDPSQNAVLYLARPCQYVSSQKRNLCEEKYWTSHRLAPEVITASNEAIDTIKQQVGAKHIVLVGYSGGGGVAALVAAQRQDVVFFGSIAGLLNINVMQNYHKVSPLVGSLNPQDSAYTLRYIPQRHMSSPQDAIIPPMVSENFCKALQKPEYCVQAPNMTHDAPWYTVWNYSYL